MYLEWWKLLCDQEPSSSCGYVSWVPCVIFVDCYFRWIHNSGKKMKFPTHSTFLGSYQIKCVLFLPVSHYEVTLLILIVTFIPLESIRPTHRFQICDLCCQSDSLVPSRRLVSLSFILQNLVQIFHLPNYSSLIPSVTCSPQLLSQVCFVHNTCHFVLSVHKC